MPLIIPRDRLEKNEQFLSTTNRQSTLKSNATPARTTHGDSVRTFLFLACSIACLLNHALIGRSTLHGAEKKGTPNTFAYCRPHERLAREPGTPPVLGARRRGSTLVSRLFARHLCRACPRNALRASTAEHAVASDRPPPRHNLPIEPLCGPRPQLVVEVAADAEGLEWYIK